MAIKWTTTRNERLLLLIVGEVKVNPAKLAEAWTKQYGDDDFQPTARAISEQFGVLKKKAGVKGSSGVKSSNGISTPKTPRTTTTPASKTTSATKFKSATPSKRKRSTMSSSDDDDGSNDDDDDSEPDVRNLPKPTSRASLSRSKKVPKRYEDPESPSEGETFFKREKGGDVLAEGEEIRVARPKTNGGGGLEGIMSELMAAGAKVGEEDGESDVSDFAQAF